MPTILACTDGSTFSESVYQHAAWASRRLLANVEVLHVINHHRERSQTHDLSGAIGLNARDELTEELTRLEEAQGRVARFKSKGILEEARKRLAAVGVANVITTQRHGNVVDTQAEFAARAELVVIGKSGENAVLPSGRVGGHLEELVRIGIRPVLVAEREFRAIGRFIIAFDNSPSARKAVAYVAASPLLRDLQSHLIMVGRTDAAHETALNEALDQLVQSGFEVTAELIPGNPASVIAEKVKMGSIDLLVMGAYGHSQIREFFVGSTTTKLVRTCPVTVLMCR